MVESMSGSDCVMPLPPLVSCVLLHRNLQFHRNTHNPHARWVDWLPLVKRTNGLTDILQHGAKCLPVRASQSNNPSSNGYSEDCLFLDVYAPSNATANTSLPVYVFIQGGGFIENSGNYNGSTLVKASDMQIVVVMIGYRVGPYGFLASDEVRGGGSLNNGLKDQRMALHWIQDHISKVGQTLFGRKRHADGISLAAIQVTLYSAEQAPVLLR